MQEGFSFLFNIILYIGAYLIKNVSFISSVQQSDSVIHVSILFQILSPFGLLQNIEQSPLCCAGPCWLSILNKVACTCQAETAFAEWAPLYTVFTATCPNFLIFGVPDSRDPVLLFCCAALITFCILYYRLTLIFVLCLMTLPPECTSCDVRDLCRLPLMQP